MNKETQMMLVPQGSIEGYIRAANEYPMLTAEEEKSLAERLYYDGDIEAAKKLVLSHLRFVIHVAVRLVSFAVHWIKAEIHEYVLRNWRIVKVATTKAQRKLFFNLRKTKQRLGWFNENEVDMVANELGVSKEDVIEMESRMTGADVGFDLPTDDDDEAYVPSLYLEDKSSNFAAELESENFEEERIRQLEANALKKLKSAVDF